MTATMTFGDRLWTGLRILGWLGVAAMLIYPAIAMRLTTDVNWTLSDFVFAGVVLIGGAGIIELFALKVRNPVTRIAFAFSVVAIAAVIWGMSI
jgi:hypothetical protein